MTIAVITYTNSNTVVRKSVSFGSKTIAKHGEMANYLWVLFLNVYVTTALVFNKRI